MDDISEKTRKRLLLLPVIPITITLIYSFLLEFIFISKGNVPFLDFDVFKEVFQYYPNKIYEFYWYVYTPAFIIQFFWLNFLSYYFALTIWIILKIIIILFFWKKLLYSKELDNLWELSAYIILVLFMGVINEFNMQNTDAILLACGFLSYICLDKAQKIHVDEKYINKYITKSQSIIILNALAGLILAFGMFKPLFFIILPILFYKANRKSIFLISFLLWLFVSNFLFILNPDLLMQYISKTISGQTLMGEASMYNNEIFNSIFRNGFTPLRIQLWLFPTLMLYIHEFAKNKKIRKYWALCYLVFIASFQLISIIIFILGF